MYIPIYKNSQLNFSLFLFYEFAVNFFKLIENCDYLYEQKLLRKQIKLSQKMKTSAFNYPSRLVYLLKSGLKISFCMPFFSIFNEMFKFLAKCKNCSCLYSS